MTNDEEDTSPSRSKFFTKTPLDDNTGGLLSPVPTSFKSIGARQIQKEEMWKYSVERQQKIQAKRLLSPENPDERKLRPRSESSGAAQSRIPQPN